MGSSRLFGFLFGVVQAVFEVLMRVELHHRTGRDDALQAIAGITAYPSAMLLYLEFPQPGQGDIAAVSQGIKERFQQGTTAG